MNLLNNFNQNINNSMKFIHFNNVMVKKKKTNDKFNYNNNNNNYKNNQYS